MDRPLTGDDSPDPLAATPDTPTWRETRIPDPILESEDEDSDAYDSAALVSTGLDFMGTEYLTLDQACEFVHALKTTSHDGEPRSFKEAMKQEPKERQKWWEAALSEIQSLVENGTFELVELPRGAKAIGSRWVFKVKRNADGSIERYKARLVAQGFSQRPGSDYHETFAPTPRWAALRAVLVLAAFEDLHLESVDISSAFLNGTLKETVFMRQPEGFEEKGAGWVWRLKRSLYGLKQAGRVWHETLNERLEEMGFKRILCEHSIWVFGRGDSRIIIPVFIDDMTIAAKSKAEVDRVKLELKSHFKLRDLGPTSFLLGVSIERDRPNRTIRLSQRQYVLDLLDRFNFSDCSPVSTPLDPSIRLSTSMAPQSYEEELQMRSIPYINAVGALAYLAIATRPDIAHSVGVLARFSQNPGLQHWKAIKHLFRYLKGSLDYKLTYSPTSSSSTELFHTYTDTDHAGNPDSGRSTSGYLVKMGTGAISWQSRLQSIVALSTTEAEYVAATTAGQEILFLRNLLTSFGYSLDSPSTLYIDNQSALQVAKNPEHHGRMKHLDLRFYWLRDEVEKGTIRMEHIGTDEMPADLLTKPLARVKVQKFAEMMGLRA